MNRIRLLFALALLALICLLVAACDNAEAPQGSGINPSNAQAAAAATRTHVPTHTRVPTHTPKPTKTANPHTTHTATPEATSTVSGQIICITVTSTPTAGPTNPPGYGQVMQVFTDDFVSPWQDYSWEITEETSTLRYGGNNGLSVTYQSGGSSLQIDSSGSDLSAYQYLDLWINDGTYNGPLDLGVALKNHSGDILAGPLTLLDYVPGHALTHSTWQEIRVPLTDLGYTGGLVDDILLQNGIDGRVGPIYYDEIKFLGNGTLTATPTPTLCVTCPPPTITQTSTRTATPTITNTPAATATAMSGGLPWLKTAGGLIVRSDNNERVDLRGINLLRSEWVYPSMEYEEQSFPILHNYGVNLVVHGFASNPVVAGDQQYLAVLDEYQHLAEQNHMYIVFCFYYADINGDQPPNPEVVASAQPALVQLVRRYKGKSNVLFELQAEPHSDTYNGQYVRVTWNTLRPIYDRMITAMRAADNASPQKHLILVTGDGYGRDISPVVVDEYGVGYLDPIRADNAESVVYSSHMYDTRAESDDWSYALPVARAGYPFLATELGTGGQMAEQDTEDLLTELNALHAGYTPWIWDAEGCPCLLSSRTNFVLSQPYGAFVMNRISQEATRFGQ